MARENAARAVQFSLLSVTMNTLLALGKGVAGFMGNSQALVADAVESLLDVFSGLVVLYGLRVAARPADANHPYGHGKAEPLSGAFVAMALIGGAAAVAAASAEQLTRPQISPEPYTLLVLVGVIILKEGLFRLIARRGDELQSTALIGDAWHHRSDALTSAAAFVGIGVALLGGDSYAAADDWAALFACVIIALNGFRLLRPALHELMDTAPDGATLEEVRHVAEAVPGVNAVETCVMRKTGFEMLVDLHVEVDGNIPVREGHRIAHEVKDAIKQAMPQVLDVLVHVEPSPDIKK
ncbi:MAG: hypothetical protein RLZZ303_2827 [Candidatus Hydrogenedentota bacterium]|jgi:cation diffusion facilitator family transporter